MASRVYVGHLAPDVENSVLQVPDPPPSLANTEASYSYALVL
jgi:hypothetical protein